jgi:hypothetical protein
MAVVSHINGGFQMRIYNDKEGLKIHSAITIDIKIIADKDSELGTLKEIGRLGTSSKRYKKLLDYGNEFQCLWNRSYKRRVYKKISTI